MAAGDLITGNYQIELRATLMGDTTSYELDRKRGGIGGLFDVLVKQPETEFAHADGSFAGDGYLRARTATFALALTGTATAVGDGMEVMETTWQPSTSTIPLYFQWPGWGKRYVDGRPLGITWDTRVADFGHAYGLASFRITDPTIYS